VDWVVVAIVLAGIVVALFGWDRYRSSRNSPDAGIPPGVSTAEHDRSTSTPTDKLVTFGPEAD
jgi:hypothetical protein